MAACARQKVRTYIADGELVTFKDGVTSFAVLQQRMHVARPSPELLRRVPVRSEEHTSELQSRLHLVCRLLLEKKKKNTRTMHRRLTNGAHTKHNCLYEADS